MKDKCFEFVLCPIHWIGIWLLLNLQRYARWVCQYVFFDGRMTAPSKIHCWWQIRDHLNTRILLNHNDFSIQIYSLQSRGRYLLYGATKTVKQHLSVCIAEKCHRMEILLILHFYFRHFHKIISYKSKRQIIKHYISIVSLNSCKAISLFIFLFFSKSGICNWKKKYHKRPKDYHHKDANAFFFQKWFLSIF